MSRIQDIIDRRSEQNKRFRFTLLAPEHSGVHLLRYAPDGFARGQMKLTRNKTYRGLFRTLSVNELTFYKDGKNIIQTYYENYGVDVLVQLKVEIYTKTGYVDYATLKLDFATYVINDICVKIQAVDTGFMEKVKNRDDIEVNLFRSVSIDGDALTGFAVGLDLIDTSIDNNANWDRNINGATDFPCHILPIKIITSDFIEAITPANFPNFKKGACFFESENSRILTFSGTVAGNIQPIQTGTGNPEFNLVLDVYDEDGSKTAGYSLAYVYTSDNSGTLAINIDFNKQVTINKGDSVVLQVNWDVIGDDPNNYELVYQTVETSLNESYEGLPAKTVKAFGIYEAFLRTIQILTGVDDCFYSETFGRTDTPIIQYAQDGILLHLIKGKLLRTGDGTIPVKLKDLFNAVNSIYNIGMTYEKDDTGTERIRVEAIDYFYDSNVILDISDRVTNEIIEKAVAPEMIHKTVEVGFTKYGNKEKQSGFEFNTKSVFTTEVKSVLTKLTIVSPYRADGTSIIRLANNPDVSVDEDGDNDIFFIKSTRNGTGLQVETNEQFDTIAGAPYADKSLNLDLAPGRSLRRWGKIIKAGLVGAGVIRWQDTKNNTNLSTKKTTETTPVVEDSDVTYSELDDPIFYPEKYKLKIPLTNDEINIIFGNPNGLIKVTATKSGWIEQMVIDNESGETELTLIRNYA